MLPQLRQLYAATDFPEEQRNLMVVRRPCHLPDHPHTSAHRQHDPIVKLYTAPRDNTHARAHHPSSLLKMYRIVKTDNAGSADDGGGAERGTSRRGHELGSLVRGSSVAGDVLQRPPGGGASSVSMAIIFLPSLHQGMSYLNLVGVRFCGPG